MQINTWKEISTEKKRDLGFVWFHYRYAHGHEPHTRTHTHTKGVSYAADAFVFDVKKLLLCELHVQQVLKHESITKHSILQRKGEKEKKQ